MIELIKDFLDDWWKEVLTLVLTFILAVLIVFSLGFSLNYIRKELRKEGLKGIVEDIWYGEENENKKTKRLHWKVGKS